MKKNINLFLMCVLFVGAAACNNEDAAKVGKMQSPQKMSFNGESEVKKNSITPTPVVESLKKKKLGAYTSKTIGEAFDSYTYAIKKEWRETISGDNKIYVDYLCLLDVSKLSPLSLKEGVVKRELEIKFVVQESGESYISMVTKSDVKSDGNVYKKLIAVGDISRIVDAIYANKEIVF